MDGAEGCNAGVRESDESEGGNETAQGHTKDRDRKLACTFLKNGGPSCGAIRIPKVQDMFVRRKEEVRVGGFAKVPTNDELARRLAIMHERQYGTLGWRGSLLKCVVTVGRWYNA
eukprot:7932984-Pyramimonas_sp.AAC.1